MISSASSLPTDSVPEEPAPLTIVEAKRSLARTVLGKPGVLGIAVGDASAESESGPRLAILVFVAEGARADLDAAATIPESFCGYPVAVFERDHFGPVSCRCCRPSF